MADTRDPKTFTGTSAPSSTDGYVEGDRFVVTQSPVTEYLLTGGEWLRISSDVSEPYATEAYVDSAVAQSLKAADLSDYATKTYISSLNHVTAATLSSTLKPYYTATQVDTLLSKYLLSSSSSGYAKTTDLSSYLKTEDFDAFKKTAVVIPMTGSTPAADLVLTSILASYATTAALDSVDARVSAIEESDLSYLTSDSDLVKSLVRREQNSDGTFKETDLDTVLAKYVTSENFTAKAVAAARTLVSSSVSSSSTSVPSCLAVQTAIASATGDAIESAAAEAAEIASSNASGGYESVTLPDEFASQLTHVATTASSVPAGRIILADLPASYFSSATYTLRLRAVDPSGHFTVVVHIPDSFTTSLTTKLLLEIEATDSAGSVLPTVLAASGVYPYELSASDISLGRWLMFDCARVGASAIYVAAPYHAASNTVS